MKKSLFILISLFCLKGLSQNSILVTNMATSATVAANTIIESNTTPNTITSIDFDLTNTSASTKSYHVVRRDIMLNVVAATSTTADAHFCFGSQCYGAEVDTSLMALTLNSGQSASQVIGSYNILTTDLAEATAVGYSYVKYCFYNVANHNDSLEFSIKYNGPLGVNEVSANVLSSFELFPNPATDATVIKVNSQKATNAKVVIYNALGAVVSEKNVNMAEGKNKIDLNVDGLSSGVYFAQIKTANNSVTKKLIIK
ncbi:MAG: T9SS type A sorting domain-containing protein [Bacteroidetes bacterium]|nr:T9SS type A sorting domain-containing protein [Bacteroidota bacterium]